MGTETPHSMFTYRLTGILNACDLIDFLNEQGYCVNSGKNDGEQWIIRFTYIQHYTGLKAIK